MGFFVRRREQGTQAHKRSAAAGAKSTNQTFPHPLVHGPFALVNHLASSSNSYQSDCAMALGASRGFGEVLHRRLARQGERFIGLMTPTAIVLHGGFSEFSTSGMCRKKKQGNGVWQALFSLTIVSRIGRHGADA